MEEKGEEPRSSSTWGLGGGTGTVGAWPLPRAPGYHWEGRVDLGLDSKL